jgi:protein translocase, SecG subunit
MEWLSPVLMAVQVISSLSVIVLVLLQQGKGADMGSSFGSGSAGSLFGAAGAANFLSRTTKWAAIVFFASTAGLAWVSHTPEGRPDAGVMQGFEVPQAPGAVPVAPGSSVPAPAAVPAAPSSERASESAPAAEPSAAGDAGAGKAQ